MKPKTTSPANRRRAASCLWAYHDARRELERLYELHGRSLPLLASGYKQVMKDAYSQWLDYKYAKDETPAVISVTG